MPVFRKSIPVICGFALTLILFAMMAPAVRADCNCNGLWPNHRVTKSPLDNAYCLQACNVNRYLSVDQCIMSAYCRQCNGDGTYQYCSVVEQCYFGGLRTEYCDAGGVEW